MREKIRWQPWNGVECLLFPMNFRLLRFDSNVIGYRRSYVVYHSLKIDILELKFVIEYKIIVKVKSNNRLKRGVAVRARHVKLLQLKKVRLFTMHLFKHK